jgi:hypothetical protein
VQRIINLVIGGFIAALSAALLAGCGDSTPPPVVPPDYPPEITLFEMDSTVFHAGTVITFAIRAGDDNGLDSAIIEFGDGNRRLFALEQYTHFAPFFQRQYGKPGSFITSLTVYDGKRQSAREEITVTVLDDSVPFPNQYPLSGKQNRP